MAEKKTPHHDLAAIKAAFSSGSGQYTWTATRDAASLGYDRSGIDAVVQTIQANHLYPSMTSDYDTDALA